MAERIVSLKITGDASGAMRAGQQMASAFGGVAQQVKSQLAQIGRLDGLQQGLTSAGTQADRLRDKLRDVASDFARANDAKGQLAGLRQLIALQNELAEAQKRRAQAIGAFDTQLGRGTPGDVNRAARDSRREAQNIIDLRSQIEALSASLTTAGVNTRNVADEQQRLAMGAAQMAPLKTQYEQLTGELRQLEGIINRDTAAADRLRQSLSRAGVNTTSLGAAQARLQAGTAAANLFGGIADAARGKQAENAAAARFIMQQAARAIENEKATIKAAAARAWGGIGEAAQAERARVARMGAGGNFLQGVLSAGGAGFGLGAIGTGIAAGTATLFSINTALELERSQAAIAAVTGSLGEAGREMAFVRTQAERLGVDVTDMSRAWAQLQAASKGTALEGDAARQVFLAISEAAQRLNLRSFETEGALRAVGQMMSKGTVQSEELRGQLGDRLPGAFNIMARALNVTTSQLGEMLQKGQVLSSEALPAFAEELRKTFGTDINTRIETTTSNYRRLWNEIKLSAASAGGGLNSFLGPAAGAWANALREARDINAQTEAAERYAEANNVSLRTAMQLLEVEQRRSAVLDKIASAARYEQPTSFKFDPFAKPDTSFYGPGNPSKPTGPTGSELLSFGVEPMGKVALARDQQLHREIALTGEKSELAKVEWEIENGKLRTANEYTKSLERQAAIAKDRVNAVKALDKQDKKDDRSLAKSDAEFRQAVDKEYKELQRLADLRQKLNAETLDAQGDETGAALAKIREQYADFTRDLKDSAEGLDLAGKWFNAQETRIALEGVEREAERKIAEIQARIATRDRRSEFASPDERRRLQLENLGDIQAAQGVLAGAEQSGDVFGGANNQKFTDWLRGAQEGVESLSLSIRRATEGPFQQMFRSWQDNTRAMQESGAQWTESLVDGIARMAAGGKADFRSLANSIIEDIIRIQLRALVANLAAGSGGAGLFQAVGGFFANAFSPAVSPTGVVTRAGGGYVSGPGTSTSDSIPGWLSNGEFVMRTAAVKAWGRDTFEAMNAGAPRIPRFARGGYVGSGYVGSGAQNSLMSPLIEIHNYTGAPVREERSRGPNGQEIRRLLIGAMQDDLAQNGDISRLLQRQYGLNNRPGAR